MMIATMPITAEMVEQELHRVSILSFRQEQTVIEVVLSYDLPAARLAEFADAMKAECVSGRPFTAYGAAHHICASLTPAA